MARNYNSFADFEREEIRPGLRIGWSIEEIEESSGQELDFDADPFEQSLQEAEQDDDAAEDDDEEDD